MPALRGLLQSPGAGFYGWRSCARSVPVGLRPFWETVGQLGVRRPDGFRLKRGSEGGTAMAETKTQRRTTTKSAATRRRRAPAHRPKTAIERTTGLSDDVAQVGRRRPAGGDRRREQVRRHRRPGAPVPRRGRVPAPGGRRLRHGDGRLTGPHAVRLHPQGRGRRRQVPEQIRQREIGRPAGAASPAGARLKAGSPRPGSARG